MIIVATLLGLLIVGIAWQRRILALQILVALLPTYLIRFSAGGIPMTLLEVIILAVTVVGLWDVARDSTTRARLLNIITRHQAFFFFVLLFVFAGTIGVVVTPELQPALGIWKAYFVEPLLFLLACLLWIRTREQFFKVAYALIASSSVIALYGIAQLAIPSWIPAPWNDPASLRVTSLYPYPNALGLFLAPVLVLAIIMLWKHLTTSTRSYVALGCAIVIITVAIIASRSDGAVVGVVATLWACGLTTRRRGYWIATATAFLAIFFLTPSLRDAILPIVTFSDVSGDVRKVLWLGTYHLLLDHPLFGAGLSGFPKLYDLYREARHVELLQYPHNIILNFWVETGVLGVMSVLGMLAVVARQAWARWSDPLIVCGCSMVLTMVIHGLVDVAFFKNDLAVLWWFAFLPLLLAATLTGKSRA